VVAYISNHSVLINSYEQMDDASVIPMVPILIHGPFETPSGVVISRNCGLDLRYITCGWGRPYTPFHIPMILCSCRGIWWWDLGLLRWLELFLTEDPQCNKFDVMLVAILFDDTLARIYVLSGYYLLSAWQCTYTSAFLMRLPPSSQ
jgi:hypothetical protein